MRRLRHRIRRGRRRRRGRARSGRARRRRPRGGRLLVGARLRRRRALGLPAALPRRRRIGDRRPRRRPDRRRVPRAAARSSTTRPPSVRPTTCRAEWEGLGFPSADDFGAEPGRRLRAARRQHRPQPAVAARRGAAARARVARLAYRRDAAERARLRAGRRLRLLRLRLPARRQAVDDCGRGSRTPQLPERGSSSGRRRVACSSRAEPPSASMRGRCRCAHEPSSRPRARSRRLRSCSAPA